MAQLAKSDSSYLVLTRHTVDNPGYISLLLPYLHPSSKSSGSGGKNSRVHFLYQGCKANYLLCNMHLDAMHPLLAGSKYATMNKVKYTPYFIFDPPTPS